MRYRIGISSLDQVAVRAREIRATHQLVVLDAHDHVRAVLLKRVPTTNRLILDVGDLEAPTAPSACTEEVMASILAFGRRMPNRGGLLINCWAGSSRSGAAALALLAQEHGQDRLDEAGLLLSKLAPRAYPNRLMTALADEALGLRGGLLRVLQAVRERVDRQAVADFEAHAERGQG